MADKRRPRGPSLRGGGRYDPYEIVARVEKRRTAAGITRQALAAAAGMDSSQYTHKTGLRRNQFSTTELGLMADFLATASKEVLPGWPFISEEHARLLERCLREPSSGGRKAHLASVP